MGKETTCNAGDNSLIPGSGRSPGGGNGNPYQYSCLESPMDRGACWVTVHGGAKSQTWLKGLSTHTWAESRKWCWWTYFQAAVETQRTDSWTQCRGGEDGMSWESTETYTLPHAKQITSRKLLYHTGSSTWCSVTIYTGRMVWGWGSGWRQGLESGDICILMANSCSCMTETNTILYSNYPLIRNIFLK